MALLEDRDVARLLRDARTWLDEDERRRIVGLVVASIAMSIAMSLIVTAIVGVVRRRGGPRDEVPIDVAEAETAAGETTTDAITGPGVGLPVMETSAVEAVAEP